ncbi:hypothetical protein AAY473_023567 [Plecturocebus cupreus]
MSGEIEELCALQQQSNDILTTSELGSSSMMNTNTSKEETTLTTKYSPPRILIAKDPKSSDFKGQLASESLDWRVGSTVLYIHSNNGGISTQQLQEPKSISMPYGNARIRISHQPRRDPKQEPFGTQSKRMWKRGLGIRDIRSHKEEPSC